MKLDRANAAPRAAAKSFQLHRPCTEHMMISGGVMRMNSGAKYYTRIHITASGGQQAYMRPQCTEEILTPVQCFSHYWMSPSSSFIVVDWGILWVTHPGYTAADGSADDLCVLVSILKRIADIYTYSEQTTRI